nr:dUTP diphosphatase [uncultured Fusobacterium sp.]
MAEAFKVYLDIALTRGFNTNDLLETYWKKWQTNMKRINSDWVIQE